jgi:SAM-dependent methyltransferase
VTEPPAQTGAEKLAARIAAEADKQVARFRKTSRGLHPRRCPVCGYRGLFTAYGQPPRFDARCPGCNSLERHRLMMLWIDREDAFGPAHSVLHFAPEPMITGCLRGLVARYDTSDLSPRLKTTYQVDITDTGLPDQSYDRIICSHVLEHVDDRAALAEMFRILRPGGLALLMTPIVEGWAKTYENPALTTAAERTVHFGQADHQRMYGRDFRDRVRAAGFDLTEFTAVEPDVLTYGLQRGETLFIAARPRT